ncbi:thiolase family protein [Marinoscillum furvescens]|uniref:acetyl-CoA C-acyltransferase n=1 Tax=Marinoscillum furvescens DSM 4134 TaxID=1122208 RepID=A0A3D9L177_MARFU|nr:acetyl-CoA C-acyltransferase [Marinoscillum furvescens]RED94126.1 acetyl-CoA acyltransferase [Marinoscillum furvescens DSM 4134]
MDAYIVAGYRSAVGKAKKGGFRFYRPDDLAADIIKHLVNSVDGFDPKRVDDLIVGNAIPEAEQGMQMGRMISLLSLPIEVPGMIINRYCGSGLEAIHLACARIHSGTADCIIAGGTESMSLVPMLGYKTALNWKIAEKNPDYYLSMGLTAEEIATDYKISVEDSNKFAMESHQKAAKAIADGKFKDEIVPIDVEEVFVKDGKRQKRSFTVDTDECVRAETNMDTLSALRPAFKQGGQVTAGNSSPTSDGAAFVMVMSEKMVKEHNLEPIARMVSYTAAGVSPRIMGIGPVEAVPKALKQAGLQQNDIDLIELNEAFAPQSLAVVRELDLNTEILNVNGGAIALGHPLGCTGAKLSISLFNEMGRRKSKYGMVTACVGGGQGVAGIYEYLR